MLIPKRAKYRKQFRGRMKGRANRATLVDFGEYGLKALSPGWLSSRQLEAARRVLTRYTRRGGRIFIRVFPDKPVSKKSAESRMGGGKGDVVNYVAVVRPGRILLELGGINKAQAIEALNRAAAKLSVSTKVVYKDKYYG